MKISGGDSFTDQDMTDAVVDAVNQHKTVERWNHSRAGIDAFLSSLPPVRPERAQEIRAVNNRVVIDTRNAYYRAEDSRGKTHVFICGPSGLEETECDIQAGRAGGEGAEIARFWRIMAWGGPDSYDSKISGRVQKQCLESAGVQPGFFTFKSNAGEREYYFNPDSASLIIGKGEYDSDWDMLNSNQYWNFEPGDVIRTSDGREFIANADGKLDIGYGDELINIILTAEVVGHIDE